MNNNDLQALFDKIAEGAKAEALADKPIITLGELIAKLENQNPEDRLAVQYGGSVLAVEGVGSYRGYYSDLAIEPVSGPFGTVAEGLEILRGAVGQTFEGYKGGDYRMTNRTLVWVEHYGNYSGQGVTGIGVVEDVVVITSEEID